MGARGPQSYVQLTPINGGRGKPPQPDPKLTPSQAAHWKQLTASKPNGWFNRDDLLLLAELCRALDMCDRLAERIDAMDVRHGYFESLQNALGLRDKEVRRVTVLATKLRLTPQSRYDKQLAATFAKIPNGPRPWHYGANAGDPDEAGERFFEQTEGQA